MPTSLLTLRAHDGHFVSAEGGGDDQGLLTATRDRAAAWETFTWHALGSGKGALETLNGRFWCAEGGGGGALVANRLAIGPWEQFRKHDLGGGAIALETHDGHYVCAEGGGGRELVADRTALQAWETFSTVGGCSQAAAARSGVVYGNRFQCVDDGGGWLPWGLTLFWGTYGFLYELERIKAHLAWAAGTGADYVRVIATGLRMGDRERAVSPRDPRFGEAIAGLTALAATYGLRVQWTVFGATYAAPTKADRLRTIDVFCDALQALASSVFYVEVANEGWANGFEGEAGATELKALAGRLRDRLPNLVATTCPHGGDDIKPDDIRFYYLNSRATLQTHHYARTVSAPDGIWRPTRKSWRESSPSVAGTPSLVCAQEGRGPNSSGTQTHDPLVLAMDAAVAYLSGVGAYTLHCGAGIYGVAHTHPSGGFRPADLWDTEGIAPICAALQVVRALLPPDLPNWSKHRTNAPDAPFTFVDTPQEQLTAAYSATSGAKIVQLPIGIVQPTTFVARGAGVTGRVLHPVSGEALEVFSSAYHVSPVVPAVVVIAGRA